MSDDRYVLRPFDQAELARLEHQHRVWRSETDTVLDRAGFQAGDRLLDLGCGPGWLTLDLAERVGAGGSSTRSTTSSPAPAAMLPPGAGLRWGPAGRRL